MSVKSIVWTIGGSDPSSGAGIQKDLSTLADFGVYGCSVITTLTAQNSYDLKTTAPCDAELVSAQMAVLQNDLQPDAMKLGALGSRAAILVIAEYLHTYDKMVICDPVFNASVGGSLLSHDEIQLLVNTIFPHITLLTPNIVEAEALTNLSIQCYSDMQRAAERILTWGVGSVLIKGGHLSSTIAADYFCDQQRSFWLQSPMLDKPSVHGTGCLLSSALAALVALNYNIYDAMAIAKMYVNQSIRHSVSIGKGQLFSQHLGWPTHEEDLPWITKTIGSNRLLFPDCGEQPIGFYPIVDTIDWVKRLMSQGVQTIQLRIKNQPIQKTEHLIKESIIICKKNNIRLFINDYWELAIKHQAYGVHLGQEDLETADLQAIKQSGLRLGISTHCFYEVARAHAYGPSYLAFGPIYETSTKTMSVSPRGIEQLAYWVKLLSYPLVAIGGIHFSRVSEVLSTGVSGVSVISAVTQHADPDKAIHIFLHQIEADHRVKC